MSKVVCFLASLFLVVGVGCTSTLNTKVGRGSLRVNSSTHQWEGFDVNPDNGERSVTLGFVTLGGDATLVDRWEPDLLNVTWSVVAD